MEPKERDPKLKNATPVAEIRQPDPRKTLVRAVGILLMLAISAFGMLYVGWYIMKMK